MQSSQFVEAYRRTIPPQDINRYGHASFMGALRQWDNDYGQVLHDYLSSGVPVDPSQYGRDYIGDVTTMLPNAARTITRLDLPEQDQERLSSELGFHRLNLAMFPMWWPLIGNGSWKTEIGNRNATIVCSQQQLAITGLGIYMARDQHAGKQGGYRYFNEDFSSYRRLMEGSGSEFDAGIITLEAIKRWKDVTVVPGPRQFEADGLRTKKTAADFVVVSTEGKAIGIQVKSFVGNQTEIEHYDPSRIVIIDASTDLGDTRHVRTQQESTHSRNVTWSGTVAAHIVANMKLHGNSPIVKITGQGDANHLRTLQLLQMRTRRALGGMSNNNRRATAIVAERIARKLYAAPSLAKTTTIDLHPGTKSTRNY